MKICSKLAGHKIDFTFGVLEKHNFLNIPSTCTQSQYTLVSVPCSEALVDH